MPNEGARLDAGRQTEVRVEADDRDLRAPRVGAQGPYVNLAEQPAEGDEVVVVDERFAIDDDAVCLQCGLAVRGDAGVDELMAMDPRDLDADLRLQLGNDGGAHGGSFDAGGLSPDRSGAKRGARSPAVRLPRRSQHACARSAGPPAAGADPAD